MGRKSGIILPIFSLWGEEGIGTMGKSAFKFIDFLKKTGQSYWQILPLGHTINGSPYEVISAFAGNPFLIDLELLAEDGLLDKTDLTALERGNKKRIDYPEVQREKEKLLRKAYGRCDKKHQIDIFLKANSWLADYALYCSLNVFFHTNGWTQWDNDLKRREEAAIGKYKKIVSDEMGYWYFVQYEFAIQWGGLKAYANSAGIEIIGDIPFYVSLESVDVWANPELFKLNKDLHPVGLAGCPPDHFNKKGQYWGYPVYDWEKNKKTGYQWWISRIEENRKKYDVIRLDHFIGFERYWEIPHNTIVATEGCWKSSCGFDFFLEMEKKLGKINLIVEDLGAMNEDVNQLRMAISCKGMKVLIWAFDSREEIDYRPHTYKQNTVVYTTVHDTDTINGWLASAPKEEVQNAINYLALTEEEGYHWGFLRGCFSSVGDIAMAQLQDVCGLGQEARMNLPPLLPDNWVWRAEEELLTNEIGEKLYQLTKIYDRLPEGEKTGIIG